VAHISYGSEVLTARPVESRQTEQAEPSRPIALQGALVIQDGSHENPM
jgi:hypothetical protein